MCMYIHARRIGVGHLANAFFISCRDEVEEETVLDLLGTCPAVCQKRTRHLDAYYIDFLGDLSKIDVGSLRRFNVSSSWFKD